MKVKQLMYRLAIPVIRLYWRIFKPKTFGVRVLILHPKIANTVLMVRHTYGNTLLWNLPGGGYNPTKESAEDAAIREVSEETGMKISTLIKLGEYRTSGEGKRDTVTLFKAVSLTDQAKRNGAEISQSKWMNVTKVRRHHNVAKVAKRALDLLL